MYEIWAIILAAGESKRMHQPKMLLPFGNKTIIEKVIGNVISSGIRKVIVVLGSDKDNILKVTKKMPVMNCYNKNYRQGMLSSVQSGFRQMDDTCRAVLVFLGDQPGIGPDVINSLTDAYRKSGKGIIMPVFNNERGHPLLFDSKYRDEITGLDPSATLRDLVRKFSDDVLEVKVKTESVLKDIDTKDDYINEINKTN
jgi:molybdenum cofactor cytidylyltransferase